mmetsp:Transcript_10534/g.30934  ORF Transcript_10534/g.30934 Transcript_10534/m.30934 type:complete len:104 (+) Transcript_10534:825-1136(+)
MCPSRALRRERLVQPFPGRSLRVSGGARRSRGAVLGAWLVCAAQPGAATNSPSTLWVPACKVSGGPGRLRRGVCCRTCLAAGAADIQVATNIKGHNWRTMPWI